MQKIWFTVKYNYRYDDMTHTDAETLGDGEDIREMECVLALPDCYSETGDAVPLIFSAHGAGSRVNKEEDKTGGLAYVAACIDAGYAAFDVHGTRSDGRSYGNRRYLEAAHSAYMYVLHNYNVQDGLFVAGASMGGLHALNFAQYFPRDVRVVGAFYPRTNLHAEIACGKECIGVWEKLNVDAEGLTARDKLAEAYGFENAEVFEEKKTLGFNPWYTNTVVIDGERYTRFPCPLKIWHGTADQTIDYELSVEYVAGVRRAGCYAELRTLDGQGHKHNGVMRDELRMWLDRFR